MPERFDPFGNFLPPRLRYKNGAYHYVVRQTWTRIGGNYAEGLREWARREGATETARTVAQAVEAYLVERGPELAPKTLKGYNSSATRIAAWAGPVRLDELTRRDVRQWLRKRAGTKAAPGSPVSANRDLALLRVAYSNAIECGWCDVNPAAGVRRRPEKPRRRIATPSELRTLSEHATPMWRAILAVELLTGMREGELRLLRRDALTDDGLVLVRPKTGAESVIEWTSALRDAISAALDAPRVGSLYVFPSKRGGPYSEDGFRTIWWRLCKKAGVEGLEFRDLRRTAATASASLEDARALLGHSSAAITQRVYRPRERAKPTG